MRMRLAVGIAVLTGALARAQERVIVHEVDERQVCSVKVTPFSGSTRPGGLGFVLVDAQNHDGKPHALQVDVQSWNRSTQDISLHRSLMLGPEERGRFFLPLPNASGGYRLTVVVDATTHTDNLHLAPNRGFTALLVSDRPQVAPQALAIVQATAGPARNASEKQQVVACNTIDLPADWRCFTGFDMVIVDGRSRLPDEAQQALRRYAFAGGTVLVGSPRSLPAGALRDRLEGSDLPATVAHGLGFVVATGALEIDPAEMRDLFAALPAGRPGSGRALWPAPEPLLAQQDVPGLDEAPVLVFLCVILLFAALAGPVNFFLLRRWRRPLLALVTVPALGFGTTLLMLGYALVHDGFGVRGVVRTWTLLDQRNHEAVTIGARTLFAGLAPDALQIDNDAMVLAPAAFHRPDSRRPDRWHFDGDSNRLDGGVLPSRTTSVLLDARQGVARERLRARLRPDGALDLLTDGGVVPTGTVLLRDPDGGYWAGEGLRLARCTDAEAGQVLDGWISEVREHRIDTGVGHVEASLELLVHRLVRSSELPPGSYCTRVAATPWAPEHGLRADYDVAQHYVFGLLAAEDFLR